MKERGRHEIADTLIVVRVAPEQILEFDDRLAVSRHLHEKQAQTVARPHVRPGLGKKGPNRWSPGLGLCPGPDPANQPVPSASSSSPPDTFRQGSASFSFF